MLAVNTWENGRLERWPQCRGELLSLTDWFSPQCCSVTVTGTGTGPGYAEEPAAGPD